MTSRILRWRQPCFIPVCRWPSSIFFETLSPSYIQHATSSFDDLIRESLSDLAGGPQTDWAWQKASLPSSLDGLNIRSDNFQAPAAYMRSLAQSDNLKCRILSHQTAQSKYLVDFTLILLRLRGSLTGFLSQIFMFLSRNVPSLKRLMWLPISLSLPQLLKPAPLLEPSHRQSHMLGTS